MPYFCYELHFRRPERIVFGKCKMGFKDTTFTVNRKKKHNRLKVSFSNNIVVVNSFQCIKIFCNCLNCAS